MPDEKVSAMDLAVLDVRDFLEEAAGWLREFSGLADEPDEMKKRAQTFLRAAASIHRNWNDIKGEIA